MWYVFSVSVLRAGDHLSSAVVPSVSAVTAEVAAYEGKKVFLSCSVEGADVTELVWVANGQVRCLNSIAIFSTRHLSHSW